MASQKSIFGGSVDDDTNSEVSQTVSAPTPNPSATAFVPGASAYASSSATTVSDIKKDRQGALVNIVLLMVHLKADDRPADAQAIRNIALSVWTGAAIDAMQVYLVQSKDAAPTDTKEDITRYALAIRRRFRNPEDTEMSRHYRDGLEIAGRAILRLERAGLFEAAVQVRQRCALIWMGDSDVQGMVGYLQRRGKDGPTAGEARRYREAVVEGLTTPGEESEDDAWL